MKEGIQGFHLSGPTSLYSKFEKLLKFENRRKSEHFLAPGCYFDQKTCEVMDIFFFFIFTIEKVI